MILEVAYFDITPGTQAAFEQAFTQAQLVIGRAAGYRGHQLQRGIEHETKYLLLVQWDSVAAHMVGFRESADFAAWRALLGPFFNTPPVVEHFTLPKGLDFPASTC